MDIKTAKEIFERHNGIMRTKDLSHHRIYSVFVKKLIEEGYVERIKYGYYQWQDDRSFSEVAVIVRLFPDAVLCMESALQFYGYTDRTPSSGSNSKVTLDALCVYLVIEINALIC